MQIIPSIDCYNDAIVRLKRGDFNQLSSYDLNLDDYLSDLYRQGARYCHVVNLKAAELGFTRGDRLVDHLINQKDIMIQMGGGIRDQSSAKALLEKGVARVVIGSWALTSPDQVLQLCDDVGTDRIVIAVDVAHGQQPYIKINGWKDQSDQLIWSLLDKYRDLSGLRILSTDVSRDGMLQGPSIEFYKSCVARYPQLKFQASGGVSSIDDLIELQAIGLDATIVGKALMEGDIRYQDACEVLLDAS